MSDYAKWVGQTWVSEACRADLHPACDEDESGQGCTCSCHQDNQGEEQEGDEDDST